MKIQAFNTQHAPFIIGGLIALLIITLTVLGIRLRDEYFGNPVIHVPTPKMPSPNAYDYYLKAANVTPKDVPISRDYAKITPMQRAKLLGYRPQVEQYFIQGISYSYLEPPENDTDQHNNYVKLRNLARYFTFLANIEVGKNHWAEAMKNSQYALRLGTDMQHGAQIIGSLVGINCQQLSRPPAWNIVEHLTLPETRQALTVMREINTREVPFTQVLQQEEWYDLAELDKLFHRPNWQREFAEYFFESKHDRQVAEGHLRLFCNKRQSVALLTKYIDTYIAIATQPYAVRKPEPMVPNNMICKALAPTLEKPWCKILECQAANHLLTIQLALHAYHGEHSVYPTALSALVTTDYLDRLPDDPFVRAGSFHYQQQGNHYLLYSLGPDCQDNAGAPIMDPKNPTQPAKYLQVNSKGDIVAGKNLL